MKLKLQESLHGKTKQKYAITLRLAPDQRNEYNSDQKRRMFGFDNKLWSPIRN